LPFVCLFISASLVVIDQVIKYFIVENLAKFESTSVIGGFLDFKYIENFGAGFGILQNQRWFFIIVVSVIIVVIIFIIFKYKAHSFCSYAAAVLILAGGAGNLVDRIANGYVIDYIHVLFFPYIFNFADCCVTIGAIFFIIHVLFFTNWKSEGKKLADTAEEEMK